LTRTVTLMIENFLTAWMSSTLSAQWLWIPARQCSITPRKSDATLSTTEHSRLHDCWWIWASCSPDLNSLDSCFWDILQDLVYEGGRPTTANQQDLKEPIKNMRKVTTETVRKSIAQW